MLPIDKKIEILILKSIISFNTHTHTHIPFFSHLSKCISKSNKAVRIDYKQDKCNSETEYFLNPYSCFPLSYTTYSFSSPGNFILGVIFLLFLTIL